MTVQHVITPKGPPDVEGTDGFDAIGKPIPSERLQSAYAAVKQMIPEASTEDAMALVGKVANALERDKPYEAMRLASGGAPHGQNPELKKAGVISDPRPSDYPTLALDMTGTYRLLAHLLA